MSSKSNKKVSPNQLGTEVSKILTEYTDDVVKALPDIVKDVAKDTVQDLKDRSSELFGGKKYKRSFKSKKLTQNSSKAEYTVYSTEYRITYLLENGHIIKNKTGKVYGTTQARPHWEPAEQEAVKKLEEKIAEAVKK